MIKFLSATTLIFLLLSGLMGKLYVDTKTDLEASEGLKNSLLVDLEKCGEDKGRLKESAKQDDTIIEKKEELISTLNKEKEHYLDKISKISSRKCEGGLITYEDGKADINDKLPDELIELFQSVYKRENRSPNTPPK